MGYSFCAFGTGTHGGLEPDTGCLFRHLSYALTTLDFQERGLNGAGRDSVLMSTSVLVQGPFDTSL